MAIMTTITVASLRSLPAMAVMGWSSILLYLIPALLFFVPTALISAELGSNFDGGVYGWVKEGLGERWGLAAIWMQWIHNVVWYPAQLAMVAASATFIVGANNLSNSGVYTAIVIVVVFWWAVWVALRGGNLFAKIASNAGLIGVIIPAALLLIFGAIWLITKQPIAHTLSHSHFLPPFTGFASVSIIVSNVLSFAGMEVNAVHANLLKEPKKGYTRVISIAFVFVLGIFILPTLIMAMTVPKAKLGMTNGAMVTFQTIFNQFHIGWMSNVIALAIVFGAIASIISWISGPSRGLYNAAKDGALPGFFHKTNQNEAQEGILILMGVVVTLLAGLYLFFPNVSEVFLVLTGMAVALYVCMYLLMFLAAINLRLKGKTGKSGYRAPALYLLATMGIVACVAAFLMTFVPSSTESGIPTWLYPILVGGVFLVLSVPSMLLFNVAQKKIKQGKN